MTDLTGKTAFVVNASSVIGRACVETLAKAGAKVCAGHDAGASSPDADFTIAVDSMTPESWTAAFKACVEEFGRLDVLVIVSEGQPSVPLEDLVFADFVAMHRSMAVPGFFAQSQGILAMREAGNGGAVIHVLPAAARAALDGAVASCVASAGLLFSSKSAALECAKAKDGIVVNTILAGPVDGASSLPFPDETVPVTPAAIADSVLFYATDGAEYMSGMDLPVDNGFLAQ